MDINKIEFVELSKVRTIPAPRELTPQEDEELLDLLVAQTDVASLDAKLADLLRRGT